MTYIALPSYRCKERLKSFLKKSIAKDLQNDTI
jgi:hypothetical protein